MAVSAINNQPTYQCAQCGADETTDKKLSKCARCHIAKYCNAACQKEHWPKHKLVCNKVLGPIGQSLGSPQPADAARVLAKNEGILYAVKRPNGDLVASFCLTVHKLPKEWQGINPKICERVKNAHAVLTETNLVELKHIEIPQKNGGVTTVQQLFDETNGIDWNIMVKAEQWNISVFGLETYEAQEKKAKAFQEKMHEFHRTKVQDDIVPGMPRHAFEWLDGNEEASIQSTMEMYFGHYGYHTYDEVPEQFRSAHKALIDEPNDKWAGMILTALKDNEKSGSKMKKLFIGLGGMHFFDYPPKANPPWCKGLITRFREAGYTVERD